MGGTDEDWEESWGGDHDGWAHSEIALQKQLYSGGYSGRSRSRLGPPIRPLSRAGNPPRPAHCAYKPQWQWAAGGACCCSASGRSGIRRRGASAAAGTTASAGATSASGGGGGAAM